VSKRFGNIVAVERLSLDIFEREFFALLGPSGCGKTTLLRMLAGFEQPSEGRILLDGADISGLPPHRRPVNMMFQSYALFPHLTVEANIAFGLVTHDQEEAMTLADRIGVMNGGRLAQVATPSDIYERPSSRWVADFIGDVNLIEGQVVSSALGQIIIESAAAGRVRVAHATE